MGERRKLLLIGWDAADWRIARPLMASGWMPHLDRLIGAGASGSLASLQPRVCPMVWTSVVTGKRAHKHGIHGCAEPLPDGSDIRAVSSTSRTCKSVWNILTQRGLGTHAINWPASHPAEPINGVCISNRFATLPAAPGRPWPPLEQVVHPAGLADTLGEFRVRPESLDASALLPFVPRAREIDQDTDRRLMTCAMLLARASTIHAAATWCIQHQPWDFTAVLYDGIELFCRQFGDYQPPGRLGIPPKDVESYQHVVTAAYCFHDMMLGRLLELAGDETTVLLVSDHGYRADRRPSSGAVDDDGVHRPPGLWAMRGPGVKRGAELHGASVLDVTPTVLRLLGQPVAHDMDGRVWVEAIDGESAGAADTPIGSWEEVPGEAGLHPPGPAKGDESLGSIQHLLDLGYVEPRDDPTVEAVRRTRERNQHNLARVLLEAGQPAQAATLLEPMHQRLPANAAVAQTLFEAYLAMERVQAARELAESALAHGVDPTLGHLALAAVNLAMRSPAAALEHLETADRLGAPAAGRLQVLVGQGYRRLRRWERAERAFRRATETDPDDAEAWHGLATVALAQNSDDGAAEFALRALELRPDYPEAHYHLGVALMGLGRADEAAVALKRCVAVSPNMLAAYRRLVELYQGPLQDEALARACRREAHVLILQRRLRRRGSAPPPWALQSPAPSEPGTP